MDNKEVINKFYTAMGNKDWETMQSCYHPDVQFSDPVFPNLKGNEAKAMWHMLLAASTDLEVKLHDVEANEKMGSGRLDAYYTYSKTSRKVYNKIKCQFEFKNNLIIRHRDHFDLWRWSGMALGTAGVLFGWTPFMQQKIRAMARKNLGNFISKNPSYQ